jgi:PAS domain S-box-containing protein
MADGNNWVFEGSPLLALRLDQSLACSHLTGAWQDRLAGPASKNQAKNQAMALAELIDFAQNPSLLDQFKGLMSLGDNISDASVGLLMVDGLRQGRLSAWRVQGSDDEQPCAVVVVTDFSDFDRKMQELSELQKRQELILGAAGEGIYGLDRDGRITFGNAATTEIVGWRADDVLGQKSHDVHHHSHTDGSPYPREDCPIYAALKDGEVHRVDNEVFWHANGSPVAVEYTSTPILTDGKPDGAVVVFRDITERKDMEKQREAAFEEIKQLKEQLEQERDYLRDEINTTANFGEIIGESQALRRVFAQIEAVAKTPVSVLIYGASGVGKEMIARAIHTKSERCDKQMVKVNCASIPKDLFESEFFGHVRGAFTGAHQERIGRLQLADGGTLFLDEIGEIPMSQQGKLLRALQEGEFERVGDDKTIKVNVRVIAATNRNLMDEIKAERFREDLFYRISVFPVEVPPLSDRLDDIAPLASYFLETICRELGREPLRLTQSQLSALKRQPWPGNIRELKNVIERAAISSTGNRLRLDLALPHLTAESGSTTATLPSELGGFITAAEFRELEKANLTAALIHSGWKTWGPGGAAELLGIKPSTLAYQMKVLGIKKIGRSEGHTNDASRPPGRVRVER